VVVPVENRLGDDGRAFGYLSHNLAQERLSIALTASAAAQAAVRHTLGYVQNRSLFGKPLSAMQNTRFSLAESAAETEVIVTMTDKAIRGSRLTATGGLTRRRSTPSSNSAPPDGLVTSARRHC
jgi:acyl-CoA dehydrogenase